MPNIHHRCTRVGGHQLFYWEAGPTDAPVIVLLHGFPTRSFMFRCLIPALADRCRVVAPDHLGSGFSDSLPVDDFTYAFDALTDLTVELLTDLGAMHCALYVHDYGAPIGWRIALRHPDAITAIITQNGNGYEAGFIPSFWQTVWDYQREQTPATEAAIRQALTLDVTRWQYLTGVPDPTLVDPDAWHHDYALSRPGNDQIKLARSATTRRTRRCTRPFTITCTTAAYLCWRCGGAATRSSAQPALRRSPPMPSTRRSICSTAGTSCSRAPVIRSLI